MIAVFDTSAILKLLLDEPGRLDAVTAWSLADSPVVSRLAYVEAMAGLAAARRAGRLGPHSHAEAMDGFERAWADALVIELGDELARRAGGLAETYGLTAGDAVQLATAIEIGSDDTVLVAWDRRLRTAATAAGLPLFPPEP